MRELKSANNTTRTKSKLFNLFQSPISEDDSSPGTSTNSDAPSSPGYNSTPSISPPSMSPWNAAASPFVNSPWTHTSNPHQPPSTGLFASLTREHGHLYSLAAKGNLLYTGSDSKNIRVWKNHDEFSGFKSSSGLVKAIILSDEKIFTGHQDGKIRVWKVSTKDPTVHKRIGTLPRLKDFLKSSINPSNYVEVRRHRNTVWLRHFDAVSCLSLDEEEGLLYSGSWDKTFKVWRISDSRCLESVNAHDDAINSVAVGFSGMVFTGSADGTVKVWRREKVNGKSKFYYKHVLVKVLLKQESAVTAVAVSHVGGVVYCGSSDGAVNYWDNGRKLVHGGVLRGHKLAVLCVATAGNLVISGSADRTIRVWRREGGDHVQVAVLKGHVGPIKCLAVVEEEEEMGGGTCGGPRWVVYSGSLDKSVKIWRVAEKGGEGQHVMMTPPPHVMEEGKWGFGSDLRWVRNWAA